MSILKKCVRFLCLLFAFITIQCAQSTSSEENATVNFTIEDPLDSVLNNDTIQTQSKVVSTIKKLPSWPTNPVVKKGKRYPFDNASKDPSFFAFREKLYDSVIENDLTFLSAIVHNDIKFSFGAENGKEDFFKAWNLDSNPERSPLWHELEEILVLGGGFSVFDKIGFYAPYIYVLDDIEDPFTQVVIIGENVRLRDQPSSKGKVIGSLSWDLADLLSEESSIEETINGETHLWQKVKSVNGETGYVYGKYIRSPIDFRAGFKQYDGRWMMDLFIAGD